MAAARPQTELEAPGEARKKRILHRSFENVELGIEGGFVERLGARWKTSPKTGPREGFGNTSGHLLETGKWGRRR